MNEQNTQLQKICKLNILYLETLSDQVLLDLESMIIHYLDDYPKDSDMWLKLALVEFTSPLEDYDRIESCINSLIAYDKDNIHGLLILAYAQYIYRGQVSEDLFVHLQGICITITDKTTLSMSYLAMAWHYAFIDKDLYEQLLLKSIYYCNEYVNNYVLLGELYFDSDKKIEGKRMFQIALKNIKKVYSESDYLVHMTDINVFFNEYFKGIYITKPNLESIQELIL